MFEMAAGYELTHLRPTQADYMAVDKKVRPVLEFIFEQGFPHNISEVTVRLLVCSLHLNIDVSLNNFIML